MLDLFLSTEDTKEQLQREAFAVAKRYLQTVKGWKVEDYSLEAVHLEGGEETPIAVVDGIYLADLCSPQRGGGESVQLTIDLSQQKVVCELAYQ